jgi:N5-(cytidine 5'-diphosphoramidyl)-L-glutamine hydrolase
VKAIAVTQSVLPMEGRDEKRDSLDQQWSRFLLRCGLFPLLLPNHIDCVPRLLESVQCGGILLTGGNDLAAYGGDAPERDLVEEFLLDLALEQDIPLLGVCRGMQMLQHRFGTPLVPVEGHVTAALTVCVDGTAQVVNSYHRFGAYHSVPPLVSWASSNDGVVKGVLIGGKKIRGIMWHPERIHPFRTWDVAFFTDFYRMDSR